MESPPSENNPGDSSGPVVSAPEEKSRRRSQHSGPEKELGKPNLSFVLEESEDDDDKETESTIRNKNIKCVDTRKEEVTPSGKSETGNNYENNNNSGTQKRKESETGNGEVRRRSSAEVIRQSRAYKRFSKALSQVSLGQFQPKEVIYTLEGVEEEVRRIWG